MAEKGPRWGISTGLAFKDKPLVHATRDCLQFGAQVVELCPNGRIPDRYELRELKAIKEGEGIEYTVHSCGSIQLPNNTYDEATYTRHQLANESAFITADEVGARWIVQHPPYLDPGQTLAADEKKYYSGRLGCFTQHTPFVMETGAIYWRDGAAVRVEDARDPIDLFLYLQGGVIGAVADVGKMSTYKQHPRYDREHDRQLRTVDDYVDSCKMWGISIKELHLVGSLQWQEHMAFNRHAIQRLQTVGLTPEVYMIESFSQRLADMVALAKDYTSVKVAA